MKEVDQVVKMPDFKGHLTDIGGPSANMYKMKGKDETVCAKCSRYSCIFPKICSNLNTSHDTMNKLYKQVREHADVKMVTIGSGIRLDMFDYSRPDIKEYVSNLIKYHVSGRLKVAPEHTEEDVLVMMRKPPFASFEKFSAMFHQENKKIGKKQQLIPYFISSHPASKQEHMSALSDKMKSMGIRPEQVQDFTPTPMTLATVIFYTGIDPYTLKPVFTAKNKEEKLAQKEKFFWYNPEKKYQPDKRKSDEWKEQNRKNNGKKGKWK